jgi:hypothetical protein
MKSTRHTVLSLLSCVLFASVVAGCDEADPETEAQWLIEGVEEDGGDWGSMVDDVELAFEQADGPVAASHDATDALAWDPIGELPERPDFCPDPESPNVDYISEDLALCAKVSVLCLPGSELIPEGCGCGCWTAENPSDFSLATP